MSSGFLGTEYAENKQASILKISHHSKAYDRYKIKQDIVNMNLTVLGQNYEIKISTVHIV